PLVLAGSPASASAEPLDWSRAACCCDYRRHLLGGRCARRASSRDRGPPTLGLPVPGSAPARGTLRDNCRCCFKEPRATLSKSRVRRAGAPDGHRKSRARSMACAKRNSLRRATRLGGIGRRVPRHRPWLSDQQRGRLMIAVIKRAVLPLAITLLSSSVPTYAAGRRVTVSI